MPITSLQFESAPPQPSVSDDIGANVQMLEMLGLVNDANREAVVEEVTVDFQGLQERGVAGEKLVAIPPRVSLATRVLVLNGLNKAHHGEEFPDTYVYSPLWVPGTEAGSYDEEDLSKLGPEYDGKKWDAHGRVIIPNPESREEPILHHLGKPYDDKYAREGEETQLAALAAQKEAFEAEHSGLNLNALPARDVASLAIVRLIKGEKFPMEWGFMRDATLPRRTVGGDSIVGGVYSSDGLLELAGSRGGSYSRAGVGVWVGQNPSEAQAS
jgi:hypothetical protein